MTVTVGAISQSLRTGITDPMTWSHANVGNSPRGVVVMLIHGSSALDHVSSVSYGTVALKRFQRNVDTTTEPGAAEIWFAGFGIPISTQTVSCDLTSATTEDIFGICYTLHSVDDLEVVDTDGINNNVANPSVTLQYLSRTCMAFAALYSGQTANSDITAGTSCTKDSTTDLAGNFTCAVEHQTTAGSSNFVIGFTSSNDDVALSAIAVSEINLIPPIRMNSCM